MTSRVVLSFALAVLVAPSALRAQCCLGARHVEAESPDGRWRVAARSLSGVGPSVHGPYHYEFASFRKVDGGEEELGRFERKFDTRAHFSMRVHVSPTGNGFVLATSVDPALVLYGWDGTELRRIEPIADSRFYVRDVSADQLFMSVESIDGPTRARERAFTVFLPLGTSVGEERRQVNQTWQSLRGPRRYPPDLEAETWLLRMLHWSPAQAERDAEAVAIALEREAEADAASELVSLGLSAWSRVQRDESAAAAKALSRIRQCAADHRALHRNLDLLVALIEHPNEQLAIGARGRLARILPSGAEPTTEWLTANRAGLVWSAEAQRYVAR